MVVFVTLCGFVFVLCGCSLSLPDYPVEPTGLSGATDYPVIATGISSVRQWLHHQAPLLVYFVFSCVSFVVTGMLRYRGSSP